MMKKILPVMLCLCLTFSTSAIATNSTDNSNTQTPAASGEMPMQGGRQDGGRGGRMGMPRGDAMPNGEAPPAMPEGEMPPAMPGGVMPGNMQNAESAKTPSRGGIFDFIKTYSTPITSVILLALAFVFVKFYKRKTY